MEIPVREKKKAYTLTDVNGKTEDSRQTYSLSNANGETRQKEEEGETPQ